MTNADLLALIRATPALRSLADTGSDAALAAAAILLAPAVASHYMLTDVGLLKLFGPVAGETMVAWLQANSPVTASLMLPSNGGLDVSDPNSPAFIASLVAAGAITQAQADTINALAAIQDMSIDHNQVSEVLAPLRTVVETDSDNVQYTVQRATPINWSNA